MATGDIIQTMRRLVARGAHTLPIPANYYEDVVAKWGLDEARIEELRSLNLLYDCDDNREFLHAYTDAFDDRFFFEIVQRIDGYQQYGAVNAAVRMAAQAQRHPGARMAGLLA
jgi:4-hydroxyphenylpyruvate dioxygenase